MGRLLDRGREFSLEGYPVPLSRDCLFRFLEEYLFIDTSDVASVSVRFGGSKGSKVWGTNDVLPAVPLDAELEVVLERGKGKDSSGERTGHQLVCLRTGKPVSIVGRSEAWCAVDALHSPVAIVDIPNGLVCRYNAAWALETGWCKQEWGDDSASAPTAAAGGGRPQQRSFADIARHCGESTKAAKPLLSALAPLLEPAGEKKTRVVHVPAGAIPVRTVGGVRGASAATAMALSDTHAVLYLHSYGSGPGTVVESAIWIASESAAKASRTPSRECSTDPIDLLMQHAVGEETASLPLSGILNGSKMVYTMGQNLKAELTLRAVACDKGGVQTPIEQTLAEALMESSTLAKASKDGSREGSPSVARRLSPCVGRRGTAGAGAGAGGSGSSSPRAARSGSSHGRQRDPSPLSSRSLGPSPVSSDNHRRTDGIRRAASEGESIVSLKIPTHHRRLSDIDDEDAPERTTKSKEAPPARPGPPAVPPKPRALAPNVTRPSRDPTLTLGLTAGNSAALRSPKATPGQLAGSSPTRRPMRKYDSDGAIAAGAPPNPAGLNKFFTHGGNPSPPQSPPTSPRVHRASPRARRISEADDALGHANSTTTAATTAADSPRSLSTPVQYRGGRTEESTTLPQVPVRRRPVINRSSIHGRRAHTSSSHTSGLSTSAVTDETRVAGAHKLTVIVADDYSVSLDLAVNFVRETGCTSIHAVDDGQGILNTLQSLRRAGEDTNKVIVITDINMPGVDGTLATAKVRSDPERYGRPYVAGCTSVAVPVSADVLAKCGMDKFVRKPLTRAIIRSLFKAAMEEQCIRGSDNDQY